MRLSLVAIVLWAAGFLGNAALFAVLFWRKRVTTVPWFTTWVGFNLLNTLILYAAFQLGTKHTYALLYWSGAFLDLALQITLIGEIASAVFRRGGVWIEGAKRRLFWSGLSAAVLGTFMGWAMAPAASSRLQALDAKLDLGATVLVTMLFTAVMVVSHQLGMSWRSLVLREGYGVAAWSVFSFITDSLHAFWRTASHFSLLDHLRGLVYLTALGYWIVVFWMPEVTPIPPDDVTKRTIESIRQRLE